MGEVISILSRQPIIQGAYITSASKPDHAIRDITNDSWRVGESFTTNDGVRVHVMEARWEYGVRQLLYCAHGTKVWASENLFRRAEA